MHSILNTRLFFLVFSLIFSASIFAQGTPTAEEIIKKMDSNRTFTAVKLMGELQVQNRLGKKISAFNLFASESNTLMEFTSIAEKGQKILKTKDVLYLYYPDAQDLITLQGSALKQSLQGSDASYEDLTKDTNTFKDYNITLTNSKEIINNRPVYTLELKAKSAQNVAYANQKLWVDQENYVILKAEYASLSGRPIKTLNATDVRLLPNGKFMAFSNEMKDLLKKDSTTFFIVKSIDINITLKSDFFSINQLSW